MIKPEGIDYLAPQIGLYIYDYWRYAAAVIILLLFVFYVAKNKSISGISIAIACYFCLNGLITATVSDSYALLSWVKTMLPSMTMIVLVEASQHELRVLIGAALLYLEILVYINLCLVLRYPNGMYTSTISGYTLTWLLGYKSSFQYYIVPGICFSLLNSHYNKRYLRSILFIVACHIQTVLAGNAMLIAGLAIIDIFLLLKLFKKSRVFNFASYSICAIVANSLVVFLHTLLFQTRLFWNIVVDLLGKSTTFTSRTILWDSTIRSISQKPIFGYGGTTGLDRVATYGVNGAIHAHNMILEILYQGGLVLLMVYIIINVVIGKKLLLNKELFSTQLLSLILFDIIIMGIFEFFFQSIGGLFWMLFMLAYMTKEVDIQFRQLG